MDKTYTIIPDFMLDYDLNMTEIVALAVIYGFCQDGKSDFHGSYGYLARKCKIEKRSAMRIVGRLERKGYVTRTLSEVRQGSVWNVEHLESGKALIRSRAKHYALEIWMRDLHTSGGPLTLPAQVKRIYE